MCLYAGEDVYKPDLCQAQIKVLALVFKTLTNFGPHYS